MHMHVHMVSYSIEKSLNIRSAPPFTVFNIPLLECFLHIPVTVLVLASAPLYFAYLTDIMFV